MKRTTLPYLAIVTLGLVGAGFFATNQRANNDSRNYIRSLQSELDSVPSLIANYNFRDSDRIISEAGNYVIDQKKNVHFGGDSNQELVNIENKLKAAVALRKYTLDNVASREDQTSPTIKFSVKR